MNTRLLIFAILTVSLLFAQQVINGYHDWETITAPSSPASGRLRLFADTATGTYKCIDSDGNPCFDADFSGQTITADAFNSPAGTAWEHTGACETSTAATLPDAGEYTLFLDSGNSCHLSKKDHDGNITDLEP